MNGYSSIKRLIHAQLFNNAHRDRRSTEIVEKYWVKEYQPSNQNTGILVKRTLSICL